MMDVIEVTATEVRVDPTERKVLDLLPALEEDGSEERLIGAICGMDRLAPKGIGRGLSTRVSDAMRAGRYSISSCLSP
jgi:hypothetical protein